MEVLRLLQGPKRRPTTTEPDTASVAQIERREEPEPYKAATIDNFTETLLFAGDVPNPGHPGAKFLAFQTLRELSDRSICAPFKNKRRQQVERWCTPAREKFDVGYFIRPKDVTEKVTPGVIEMQRSMERVLNASMPFHQAMALMMDDSLTYDWANSEIRYDRAGRPIGFKPIDSATIRRGRPVHVGPGEYTVRSDSYVQMLPHEQRIINVWHEDEIMNLVRNHRTGIQYYGYGYPEIAQALDAIVSYTMAKDYNDAYFRNGSHASAILKIFKNMDNKSFRAFQAGMTANLKGNANAHRLAMVLLNAEAKDNIEKLDLASSHNDMQFAEMMQIMIMIIAANFNMRPAEVGLPEYKGSGSSLNTASPKDEITLSQRDGTYPILTGVQTMLTRNIIERIHPDFEFVFNTRNESESDVEELMTKMQNSGAYSANEVRAVMGRPAIDRKFLDELGIDIPEDVRDRIILNSSVPISSTFVQSFNTLVSASDGGGDMAPMEGMEDDFTE